MYIINKDKVVDPYYFGLDGCVYETIWVDRNNEGKPDKFNVKLTKDELQKIGIIEETPITLSSLCKWWSQHISKLLRF